MLRATHTGSPTYSPPLPPLPHLFLPSTYPHHLYPTHHLYRCYPPPPPPLLPAPQPLFTPPHPTPSLVIPRYIAYRYVPRIFTSTWSGLQRLTELQRLQRFMKTYSVADGVEEYLCRAWEEGVCLGIVEWPEGYWDGRGEEDVVRGWVREMVDMERRRVWWGGDEVGDGGMEVGVLVGGMAGMALSLGGGSDNAFSSDRSPPCYPPNTIVSSPQTIPLTHSTFSLLSNCRSPIPSLCSDTSEISTDAQEWEETLMYHQGVQGIGFPIWDMEESSAGSETAQVGDSEEEEEEEEEGKEPRSAGSGMRSGRGSLEDLFDGFAVMGLEGNSGDEGYGTEKSLLV